MASLSEKEADSLASAVASRESAASAICEGIDPYDLEEIDGRIYQSAALGDVGAMRIFSMQSYSQDGLLQLDERDHFKAERHSEYAESMMNHAADAGDPDALNAIFFSYSAGIIYTPFNKANLRVDPVKSIAAFRALLSVDEYFLKSRYSAHFFTEAEKSIKSRFAMLNDADKIRLAEMEDAYIRAYRAERRAHGIEEELFNELPEKACADIKKERGQTKIPGHPQFAIESQSESTQCKSTPDVTRCAPDPGGLPVIGHTASSLAGHDASILDQAGRAIFFAKPNPLTHRWPIR